MDDLLTLIYTSGTTGEPKGVMLDFANIAACFDMHDRRLDVGERDVSLCMLPLSHVFERIWTFYVLCHGAENVYIRDPQHLVRVMSTNPSYLQSDVDNRVKNLRDWGIPLGRRFRALKLWCLIREQGVAGLAARLRRDPPPPSVRTDDADSYCRTLRRASRRPRAA